MAQNLLMGIVNYGLSKKKSRQEILSAMLSSGQVDFGSAAMAMKQLDELKMFGEQGGSNQVVINGLPLEIKSISDLKSLQDMQASGIEMVQKQKESEQGRQLAIDTLQSKVDDLDEILADDSALGNAVGANKLGRVITPFSGKKATVVGKLQKILQTDVLQTLIDAKKKGATFGQLSDKEMQVLRESANALAAYGVAGKDGKIKAYEANQGDFISQLEEMRAKAKEALDLAKVGDTGQQPMQGVPQQGQGGMQQVGTQQGGGQMTQQPPQQNKDTYQQAIAYAQANPNDPRSQNFLRMVDSGQIDPETGVVKGAQTATPQGSQVQRATNEATITDSRKQVVQGLVEQGMTDPKEMLDILQEQTKSQGLGETDFTEQEIKSYMKPEEKKGYLQTVADKADERVENLNEIDRRKQGLKSSLWQKFGQGVGLGADILGEAWSRAYSAVMPDSAEKVIGDTTQEMVRGVLETKPGKAVIEKYKTFKEEHPEEAANLEVFGNIANLAAQLTATSSGLKGVGKLIEKGASKAATVGTSMIAPVKKGVSGMAKYGTSQTTGLSPQTVSLITKHPEMFTQAEIAAVDKMSLATKVQKAVTGKLDDLAATGKEYSAIRQSGQVVNIPKGAVDDVLKKFGITMKNGKIATTAESVPMSGADIKAIESFVSQYGQGKLSANGFLNARKALSNLGKYELASGKTDAAKSLARQLRYAYDQLGKSQIKGLSELDAKFAPQTKLLKQLQRDWLNADGTLKDTAISKMSNLTNSGRELQLARLEKIIPGVSKDVNILKAISDITQTSGQKVGTYLKSGIIGGAVSGGNPMGALAGAIMSSPQIAVPIIRNFGKLMKVSKNVINTTINKMTTGGKLLKAEYNLIDDAIKHASAKMEGRLVSAAGKASPGLTMKDVSGELTSPGKRAQETMQRLANAKTGLPSEIPAKEWTKVKGKTKFWAQPNRLLGYEGKAAKPTVAKPLQEGGKKMVVKGATDYPNENKIVRIYRQSIANEDIPYTSGGMGVKTLKEYPIEKMAPGRINDVAQKLERIGLDPTEYLKAMNRGFKDYPEFAKANREVLAKYMKTKTKLNMKDPINKIAKQVDREDMGLMEKYMDEFHTKEGVSVNTYDKAVRLAKRMGIKTEDFNKVRLAFDRILDVARKLK